MKQENSDTKRFRSTLALFEICKSTVFESCDMKTKRTICKLALAYFDRSAFALLTLEAPEVAT